MSKAIPIPAPSGWTSDPRPAPGEMGVLSQNWNTVEGYPRRDSGYRLLRHIQAGSPSSFNKGGGSFTHYHSDGMPYPFYWFDGEWFRETGAAAASLESGLGDYFVPDVSGLPLSGLSLALLGDNTKARGFRVEGGNLAIHAWDMAAPAGSYTATGSTSGGSLPDGDYDILITQIDDTGVRTVESDSLAPSGGTVTISGGGGNGKIVLDLTAAGVTFATRASKYRVYMSVGGVALTAYFRTGSDTAKATTSFTITATTAGTAYPQRNGIAIVSALQITAADLAVVWQGRLVYGSTSSNRFGWSERDDLNHYRSTNTSGQAESEINEVLTGIGATDDAVYLFTANAVHMVTGDFAPTTGDIPRFRLRTIETGVGCLARASIVPVPGIGLFFMSTFGPAVIIAGTVHRLLHDKFSDYRKFLDYSYAPRWVGSFDQGLRQYVCSVTRLSNTNNLVLSPATAGIPDMWIRWNLDEANYSPPLQVETTHIAQRAHPSSPGSAVYRSSLTAVGPHGAVKEFGRTHGHGIEGDLSGTAYDSISPGSFTASGSAVISGTGYGDLEGVGAVFRYPTTDTAYPGRSFYREIKSSSESGGNTTIQWAGTLPTPTGDSPSIRIGGQRRVLDLNGIQIGENPAVWITAEHVSTVDVDVVGDEAGS